MHPATIYMSSSRRSLSVISTPSSDMFTNCGSIPSFRIIKGKVCDQIIKYPQISYKIKSMPYILFGLINVVYCMHKRLSSLHLLRAWPATFFGKKLGILCPIGAFEPLALPLSIFTAKFSIFLFTNKGAFSRSVTNTLTEQMFLT